VMERLEKVDVKYRFVIDIGNSFKSENWIPASDDNNFGSSKVVAAATAQYSPACGSTTDCQDFVVHLTRH
jgi:hypothetical protein